MKLITFDGQALEVTADQAKAIVDSGKTNLIEIKVNGQIEYVNANHIAAILSGTVNKQLPTVDELRKKYGD